MLVSKESGVKVLRAEGTVAFFVGDLSMKSIHKCIKADVVEVLRTRWDDVMIIDEEGKLKYLEMNVRATNLYKHGTDRYGKILDVVVGDVVVIPRAVYDEWCKGQEDESDED